ncbi:LANO_0A07052g1_1 [Lachancea nothofagi CBS 11611]|uniref:LANO_0A07052g1_1 n=1 Tax=Lachancea nothofagi CBS 11611 TaxID=1266666 RepID=A0A1G4IS00_9SACH|nr:LANO_0A07052g1_1 [Lachancea nothofagi CBS 11611]
MPSRNKVLRNLNAVERKILCETSSGLRNGAVFSATYFAGSAEREISDNATLQSEKCHRLTESAIWGALSKIIEDHAELRYTVNSDLQFEPLASIKFNDVVHKVEFECYKDEQVNCYGGAPPYLLRHIFDKCFFTLGRGKPLWQLFIVDESMVIFHGHEVLFDDFAAANFHKTFLTVLNSLKSQNTKKVTSQFVFQHRHGLSPLQTSIFDRQQLSLLSMIYSPLGSSMPALLKDFYNLAIKKPLHFIEYGRFEHHTPTILNLPSENLKFNQLCGKVVFGTVGNMRLNALQKELDRMGTSLQAFITAATIFCLEPIVDTTLASFSICVPMNLRKSIDKSPELGLFHKNVIIDCPAGLRGGGNQKFDTFRQENLEGVTLNDAGSSKSDFDTESHFESVLSLVSGKLKSALTRWKTLRFEDDDLKWMKTEALDSCSPSSSRVVEINDLTGVDFSTSRDDRYHIRDVCASKSRNSDTFISVSYCSSSSTGLTLGIHYYENSIIDNFVERLETFIDAYPNLV